MRKIIKYSTGFGLNKVFVKKDDTREKALQYLLLNYQIYSTHVGPSTYSGRSKMIRHWIE
jgi:hypothetical protein